MATLREYFDTDLSNTIKIYCRHAVASADLEFVILCDFSANMACSSCYVPGEHALFFHPIGPKPAVWSNCPDHGWQSRAAFVTDSPRRDEDIKSIRYSGAPLRKPRLDLVEATHHIYEIVHLLGVGSE